ncbi:MAG TPA: LysE family translocator, partial [SAR324 cluster bacterium]|nr:LysE family translocator [SAR324 cluster bacterium]
MTDIDFQTWIAFAVAAEILLLIPGPTILLVVAYSLSHGRTATLPLVTGVGLGDLTAMVFSFAGLGLLLSRVSELFFILKWAGAFYLVYLGIQLWRSPSTSMEWSEDKRSSQTHGGMFWHAWVTTALNPKSIVFFLAFLPQFLNPASDFMV